MISIDAALMPDADDEGGARTLAQYDMNVTPVPTGDLRAIMDIAIHMREQLNTSGGGMGQPLGHCMCFGRCWTRKSTLMPPTG